MKEVNKILHKPPLKIDGEFTPMAYGIILVDGVFKSKTANQSEVLL